MVVTVVVARARLPPLVSVHLSRQPQPHPHFPHITRIPPVIPHKLKLYLSPAPGNMNRNNQRDYRNAPPLNAYSSRGLNAPPSSQSRRWPNTTGSRLRPNGAAPLEDQPTSTPITQSDDYMNKLRALIPSASTMEKQGYTTQPLDERELLLKRRCTGCGKS